MVKLYFLGLDKRSVYLKEMYEKEEYEITEVLEEADVVILPIPFTKDRVHILGEGIEIMPFIKKCEAITLQFELGYDKLGFYNENGDYVVEKGEFEIFVGDNCFTNNKVVISVI